MHVQDFLFPKWAMLLPNKKQQLDNIFQILFKFNDTQSRYKMINCLAVVGHLHF